MFVVSVFMPGIFSSSVFRSLKMPVLIISDLLYSDSGQLVQCDLAVHYCRAAEDVIGNQ